MACLSRRVALMIGVEHRRMQKSSSLSIWSCLLRFCTQRHTLKEKWIKGKVLHHSSSLQHSLSLDRWTDKMSLSLTKDKSPRGCASSKNTILISNINLDILSSIVVKTSLCPSVCVAQSDTRHIDHSAKVRHAKACTNRWKWKTSAE